MVVLAGLALGIDAQEPLLIARQMVQRLAKSRFPLGSRVLRALLKFFFTVVVVHRQMNVFVIVSE